jgi:hypothetical protein
MHEHTTPTAAIEASGLSMRSGASTRDVSLRRAAMVAGLGLLVIFLLAFSGFSPFESLVVEGDATGPRQSAGLSSW